MLLSPPPKMQFFGDDGLPLSGGKVYTYAKGTTTPLITYVDLGGVTPNANPVILDSYGRAIICFQQLSYTLVVQDSTGVQQGCSGDIDFPAAVGGGESIAAYSDIVSYDFPDVVAGSDGYTYRCVGVGVLGDDPVGSVTGNWVNLTSQNYVSPAFTGIPTAPTAAAGTNTTQIATCAFVQTAKTPKITVFSASGTYTKTTGKTIAVVELVGGGGGGAGSGPVGQSGGSAGGYTRKVIDISAVTTETVTIGAGGAGGAPGANGTAGGTTSFGSHCSATGGGKGNYNAVSDAPGLGSGGDLNLYGGRGHGNASIGGDGGASFFGGGSAWSGSLGQAPGSGGGAGSGTGMSGADGICIVTEY